MSAHLDPQDAYILDKAVDPNSQVFKDLMAKLLKPRRDDRTRADRLKSKGEWKYTLPFRTDPVDELAITELTPFKFADRAWYRNGARSLASVMEAMVDLVVVATGRKRLAPTLVVSGEYDTLLDTIASSGQTPTLSRFCGHTNLYAEVLDVRPDVMVVDHTTVCLPVDDLLNFAFDSGVKVVDGVFPLHVAGVRGWDVVAGFGRWSYCHTATHVTVGPDDDSTRMVKYTREQYRKFTEPSSWEGNSRKYLYEIRKNLHGLATYRAIYVGDSAFKNEDVTFKLPTCSSDEMVMITINRELAAGLYASKSNNAQELAALDRNYAIEVRKDLFNSCVTYLIARDRGADVMGESVRYVTQHNYVDLVDGVRIVRKQSLSYADGLCTAMVCALVAYELRYRLTSDMVSLVQRQVSAAKAASDMPFGALGRLVWYMGTYVSDALSRVAVRSLDAAKDLLYSKEFIPGVCYDVYVDRYYQPRAAWYEALTMQVEVPDVPTLDLEVDPFANFMGDAERAYAPNVVKRDGGGRVEKPSLTPYVHNHIPNPRDAAQEVYDQLFPGNSTAQIQNASELRRVRDINVNTEFYGRVEINKDIAAPEKLHDDTPVRTATLPVSKTPLIDAILASAKRNWNPPDMQMQNSVYEYARELVKEFIDWAFVPNFRETIGAAYKKDPVSFNVTDYMAWRAGKDQNYRKMLDDECPADLVELELERYDTILKKRVKPKLNTSAQYELGQGQVIVGLSKKDTALFTSVFRVVFERFDGALRPEILSAGRMSDSEISDWVTKHRHSLGVLPAIEMDSGKYDKSQNLLARLVEAYLFVELGLDPGVMEIFQDSYVGKVSSKVLGLMFISALQMKSGAPHTMLGNLVYNFVSASKSVGHENIRFMIAKGDDNVVWVSGGVDRVLTVHKMSNLFNLESKLISDSVLYFSSGFILIFEEFGVFVPDPAKLLELFGEAGQDPRTVEERYVSFKDRVSAYAVDQSVPTALRDAMRHRYQRPEVDVVLGVDALLTAAESLDGYRSLIPG